MKNWTELILIQLLEKGLIRSYTELTAPKSESTGKRKRRSKYNATKTDVDGIMFDSEKEANRYRELKFLLKAGVIGLLELQVEFELNEGGTHSLKYLADFVYRRADTGERIVEDCKGFRTKEYRKKKRLMRQVHNIEIFET
jgi:hypothetical protein